jgi:hypothetical protein
MTDWIVVRNWRRHYSNRRLKWIKVYTALLDDPDYLQLSFRHRGLLHSLWILYAVADGQVPASPAYIAHAIGLMSEWDVRQARERGELVVSEWRVDGEDLNDRVVRGRDLKRLEQAGFIEIVASRPPRIASTDASLEVEVLRTSTKSSASAARNSEAASASAAEKKTRVRRAACESLVRNLGHEMPKPALAEELHRLGADDDLVAELLAKL